MTIFVGLVDWWAFYGSGFVDCCVWFCLFFMFAGGGRSVLGRGVEFPGLDVGGLVNGARFLVDTSLHQTVGMGWLFGDGDLVLS